MKEFFDMLLLDHRYAIGAAIVLIVIVFIVCEAVVQIFKIGRKKARFEYRTMEIDQDKPTIDVINTITAGDWELVNSTTVYPSNGKRYTVYVLRKPKDKRSNPKSI